MYHVRFAVLALVLAITTTAAVAQDIVGTADKIIDGDTLWVCDASKCQKIRLCGIDAPDRIQQGWRASRDALQAITKGKKVRCVPVGSGTDCDGRSKPRSRDRIVAQCFVEDDDIGKEMMRRGQACDWPKFSGGYAVPGGCAKK